STVSSTAGFITVQPCGGQAEVSNLNYVGGVDITNLAVVPLADDGTICVTSSARTHIVVDVFGGFGSGGLARELSIGGATMFPEFSPAQHDYIAYCQSATANVLSVHARGVPRTQVTVGSTVGSTVVDTTVPIDADDAIVVRITPTAGGVTDEYWIRCVPPDFPLITTSTPGDHSPGWYVLGNSFDGPSGEFAMILDTAGVPVWYRRIPAPMMALDVEPWSDGSMTWFTSPGTPLGLNGAHHYERRSLDGTLLATYATDGVPTDHHELLEVSDGSGDVIMIGFDIRTSSTAFDCVNQLGADVTSDDVAVPVIQRVRSNGSVVWEWDTDFTGPGAKITQAEVTVPFCFTPPGMDPIYMPIHVNSVDLAPDGTVMFTARHTDAVYAFDPGSGDILWKLGGNGTGDPLDLADPRGGPLRMHDVRVLPNGNISLFDNRTFLPFADPQGSGPARYVEYDLDLANDGATMVREVSQVSGSSSGAMGSARLQPDGGVVTNWGAAAGLPIFTETDASGSTVFELFMPNTANASYRTIKVPPSRFNVADLRQHAGK
ncbi:MAG TPA: aryl-sulfate sulfotransferase, partial [Ilumatobacteraceae bacterium]|nr:aryl-sulfate sulfotransferase [Ilumatobacteraceae bacterium]